MAADRDGDEDGSSDAVDGKATGTPPSDGDRRARHRAGGFRLEVVPAPRYQTVMDRLAAPLSWLSAVVNLEPPSRRDRDTFRLIVRNPRGEWRALRITSREEAERARVETQTRIDQVGIDAWAHEMRGRTPESFFHSEP